MLRIERDFPLLAVHMSACYEFCFGAMLCFDFGNDNSDLGRRQCSRGPHLVRGSQVPHPCCSVSKYTRLPATGARHGQYGTCMPN